MSFCHNYGFYPILLSHLIRPKRIHPMSEELTVPIGHEMILSFRSRLGRKDCQPP